MFGSKLLGNVRLPHNKKTAEIVPVIMPSPREVLLPLLQHIGEPAVAIVKIGEEVKLGQKIAEASGRISSPVHASVSGKVTKLEEYITSNGNAVPAIRIESDGQMIPDCNIAPPEVKDLESFILAVRESGAVGLGGAGFPTSVKLEALGDGNIEYVILNGAECEPYATADARTMLDDAEWLEKGIELISKYAAVLPKFIIGIEKNKAECISGLKKRFEGNGNVSIVSLPEKYPQGGEKILIYNTTKRVVGEGKLPSDVGVLVLNVTTVAFIAKYMATGMPLVSRSVTLDGSAVAEPKNIIAPIGTSLEDLIAFGGGFSETAGKVLLGGPMMGVAACSLKEPIVKTTGVVVAMNEKDSRLGEETACIRCGRCVEACPMKLNASEYSNAFLIENKEERIAAFAKHKVMLCLECGSCAYVCPANRPLVQNSRLAKAELRSYAKHKSTLKN